MQPITWEPKKMLLADLKENPDNPKIINEVGKKRLHTSLSKWGLAGTFVANSDGTIIDGHSRKADLEEQGVKEIWVSVPSRPLTEQEYKEMNALFDVAKAGEPDMMVIQEIMAADLEEWDFVAPDKGKIKDVELVPFRQTHVLLSFPPEKMIEIQDVLQKLSNLPFIQYEQASN